VTLLLPILTAFLYRFGGSVWKPARRYGIPALLFAYDPNKLNILPMLILCLILHFNLDEIEENDMDDVFCYGMAQSWCMWWLAGPYSVLVGLTWITGVLLSNRELLYKFKLDWKYVELAQGFVLGGVCLL
jgi:hypothetical protein